MKLRNHYHNKDFCIMYRTNAQSRSFEESLRRMNIPYRLYGGISFYQRKEVKDYLAYMRVIVNTQDEENIKRVINYPARGIGKTSIEKILIRANELDKTFWEVISEPGGIYSSQIENFVTMIRSF